ncbi:hypothetical protein [Sphingomicrobium clamense]|uniref:Tyr recombinase domain-containing protein n=1 Tax=Sphingomicrobium clamense TaxID=2851013 RepID=A0ABS6V876_9SPHN|nr:hypothetical protein [Sphingomicrobium sp. B8]MBW0145784.1 hypothetical protein [Sphingomicrobium sp. B8]
MVELEPSERESLLTFIGYGNPAARLRFVGAEEGLGGAMSPGEQAANLRARCQWPEIYDMREAHLTLVERGEPIDISRPRPGSTGVWRFMSRIALAAEGSDGFNDDDLVTHYVRNKLGRREGSTLLTELSPVPAKKSSRPTAIKSISEEEWSDLMERRRQRQLSILRAQEAVTICFGLGKREQFARQLEIDWHGISDRVFSSRDGMTFLLPFFGNGQLSKADLKSFVCSQPFRAAAKKAGLN